MLRIKDLSLEEENLIKLRTMRTRSLISLPRF